VAGRRDGETSTREARGRFRIAEEKKSRHATLRDVLVASDGKMGWAGKLSEPDMQALQAFLQTL
jgi:hypothetical protein